MKIYVSGTIAYDVILDYPGRFADHIDPAKAHVISLSFLIDRPKRSLGGTAANIAYNLAMLGTEPEIIAAVGKDGRKLIEHYGKKGIGTAYVQISSRHGTPSGYVFTDLSDNQIWGFYPGAMVESAKLPKLEACDWPIIAAENPKNMARLARHYQKTKHRYIFDPGQAITSLTKSQMRICARGASIVIGNDYEISQIFSSRSVVIKTLGPKGSEIILPNKKILKIGAVKARKVVDPTGAGDAYRAGLIKGIISGLDLKRSAQLGAAAATFAVEKHGTQEHGFDYGILIKRHNRNFKDKI